MRFFNIAIISVIEEDDKTMARNGLSFHLKTDTITDILTNIKDKKNTHEDNVDSLNEIFN